MYETQNVDDIIAGEDLWQYHYHVTDHTFLPGESLIVYFDVSAYESITAIADPGTSWGLDTTEPDEFLGPGLFVATAPADPGTPPISFSVQFRWLSPGQPGDQAFDLYGPAPNYVLITSGLTQPVPEPSIVWLIAAGLGVVFSVLRRQRTAQPDRRRRDGACHRCLP